MKNVILPEKCWIYFRKRYILRGMVLPELPCVGSEYEFILKCHNIPYRKVTKFFSSIYDDTTKEVCEYWDAEAGLKEKELSLPLFARLGDFSYRYCEKNYSCMVPSEDTIEATEYIQYFVEKQISEYNQIIREVNHYRFAKEKLSGNATVVSYSTVTPYNSTYEIIMNHDSFKVFRVFGRIALLDYVAIFDMNKIVPNSCIKLEVPNHIAGFVIGKGGRNIKAWAQEIGVKMIQVIPV